MPYWPDDCPQCGVRMEFEFVPVTARICACGARVTARDLIGREALPLKRRRART
jgi:hypothetical protein